MQHFEINAKIFLYTEKYITYSYNNYNTSIKVPFIIVLAVAGK